MDLKNDVANVERQRTIRKAELSELTAIMQVIEAARGIMRASGNMRQWNHGYPSEEVITADIERGGGYVIVENSAVIGYFAFLPSPEPAYEKIFDGQWLDDKSPYHVIHRVASYPGNRHIFRDIMAFCLSRDGNIRISTFQENTIMQRLMEERMSKDNHALGSAAFTKATADKKNLTTDATTDAVSRYKTVLRAVQSGWNSGTKQPCLQLLLISERAFTYKKKTLRL